MEWDKIIWRCDGTDNALTRQFLADAGNICNCECCPYKMTRPQDGKLPCGQSNCWVELSCSD